MALKWLHQLKLCHILYGPKWLPQLELSSYTEYNPQVVIST